MKKGEILSKCKESTLQTYKNEPLYIGDIFKKDDIYGIILTNSENPVDEVTMKSNLLFKTTEDKIFNLPAQKNSITDFECLGNVGSNKDLLKLALELTLIEPDENKKINKKKEIKEKPSLNLLEKINLIRLEWQKQTVEKEGHGKAGGNAKYDYYTPQQVITFALEQEAKYGLFSKFEIAGGYAFYTVIDIEEPTQNLSVQCPLEVPRKMAASEAQQMGAAITYFNRRLAMLLYKMEDNSKENLDVMANAEPAKKEVFEIPAPDSIPSPLSSSPSAISPSVKTSDEGEPAPSHSIASAVPEEQAGPVSPVKSTTLTAPVPTVSTASAPIKPIPSMTPEIKKEPESVSVSKGSIASLYE